MSFSNEEHIEEILIESHSYGIRELVMEEAQNIMGTYPKMDRGDAYQQAFKVVKQRYAFLGGESEK